MDRWIMTPLVAALLSIIGGTGRDVLALPLPVLTPAEIAARLEYLPHWTTDGQAISCTFQFADFVESVAFVNSLVEPAETAGHHPDLHVAYNRVTVRFTTHDAGGLTALDFETAAAIAHPCPPPSPYINFEF